MKIRSWSLIFFCLTNFNKKKKLFALILLPTLCINSAQFPCVVHNKPYQHLWWKGLWNESLWQDWFFLLQYQNFTSLKCFQNSHFTIYFFPKWKSQKIYNTIFHCLPVSTETGGKLHAWFLRDALSHDILAKIVRSCMLFLKFNR